MKREKSSTTNLKKGLRRYVRLIPKVLQQSVSGAFRNSAFFLQGQMDINPHSRWHNPEFAAATGGYFVPRDAVRRTVLELEPWDTTRRDMLILLLRTLVTRHVPGDLAEVGVYKGMTARLIHHYLPERHLHLFDTFEGFAPHDLEAEMRETGLRKASQEFSDTSLTSVLAFIGAAADTVHAYPGRFPTSCPPDFDKKRFAFVHLDADLYEPIRAGLEYFYPLMSRGGMLLVHDYNAWPGARKAVDEFFDSKPEFPIPMPDKSGSALIVKG